MAVICFDFDGVIADTFALESVYYVGVFKKRGIDAFQTGEDLRNACRGNFYQFCDDHGLTKETLADIYKEYQKILKDNNIVVPLFDGIADLLREMLFAHTVYIVSLNDTTFIETYLASHGVSGFAQIIGWPEATDKKGPLRILMERHSGEPFYFISDSVGDMKESVAVGVPHVIGVGYGWGIAGDLAANGADVVLNSVAELNDYLLSIS